MTGLLDGKVALVTGGAAGIGLAISRTLHGEGAAVVLSRQGRDRRQVGRRRAG